RLGVDPLSGRDFNPHFSVAVRDEHGLKLLWDGEIQSFVHFLHWPFKLPRPLDGTLPTLALRHNQVIDADLELEGTTDVVRRDEKDLVSSPEHTPTVALLNHVTERD